MKPHKLTLCLPIFLFVFLLSAEMSFPKVPAGGRLAVVVDERLAALRREPKLDSQLLKRLSRGRLVAIKASRTTSDGVIFYLVNVTSRTRGWIQREAVVSAK